MCFISQISPFYTCNLIPKTLIIKLILNNFGIKKMIDTNQILNELEKINSLESLEEFNKKYLGKKWLLNEEFKKMSSLSPEEKKTIWAQLSEVKDILNNAYDNKLNKLESDKINKQLNKDLVDISIDKKKSTNGHYSILATVRREVEEICKSMWFIIEYGTEAVTKFENFEAVNIPLTHPATEMHDTIYIKEKDNTWENLVLRTHTSAMQNYLIKKYWTPLKIVVPSRVYRNENTDATHDTMFYQLEGIVLDKDMSIAHFKGMITKLLSAILKTDVEIRMRPAYFPFVEPGFEIDARYDIYNPKTGETEKSNWIEILWAGMVHPNVLKTADLDPSEWKGFAFGIGINRVAAIRYAIKDIRYFTNGDLRFAKSFE